MADLVNLHGARVAVPDGWDDVSIYRFLPPVDPEQDAGILVTKKPRRAQPNMVVTRHARIEDDPPRRFFEVMNARSSAENASFRVIASGEADYLGQRSFWQDSTQTAKEAGLEVYQRHILVPGWEREFVLVTLTGDRKQIREMSKAMRFAPGDPPTPARNE